jgi:methylmalonyl-CoA/ethylmalonyl-CoA epimerase
MIGRLNHIAIAVRDLEAEAARYRDTLGAHVTAPRDLPEHGVTVVFVELPNTKVELLRPLGEASPIAAFLDKTGGGIHHVCYEVDGAPRMGAHGKPVLFLHPKDFSGALIELEQV